MLKLDKVSKFYSQNGIVTTGFSKVDLSFNIGEFVAITGESGSGKSTLLNVISGLDTYEEGEMYILGEPTSGSSKEDMEEYRKQYIGSIFQTFNLINSYTVYQNIELVLLLNGYEKKNIKEKVDSIIERVGLSEYRNTKASKLSGGQKQRVAIARALAKETPVIVADEPTGNLDTASAAEIIKILHEISSEKLVIIVTHNYDQVEDYITRKITMHDGKVTEDKVMNKSSISDEEEEKSIKLAKSDNLSFLNTVRLGVRNTFNIPAKFILLLIVFLFLCGSVFGEYASYKNILDATDYSYNEFFRYTKDDRILLTKPDKKSFTEKDYEKIGSIENVGTVVENDLVLDTVASIYDKSNNGSFYICGTMKEMENFDEELCLGSMPDEANEAILIIPRDSYVDFIKEDVIDEPSVLQDDYSGSILLNEDLIVSGIAYMSEEDEKLLYSTGYYSECFILLSKETLDDVRKGSLEKYCSQEIHFANEIVEGNSSYWMYKIIPNENVQDGYIYIPEDISYLYPYNASGQPLKIINKSLYFTDEYEFTVSAAYNENTFKYYLGLDDYESFSGALFVSPADYNKMFDKGNYQSSVLVEDAKVVNSTAADLEALGYEAFVVSDGRVSYSQGADLIEKILYAAILIGMLIVLFFVSYFIIKLILKSRNVYFSTVRMLGADKDNCKNLLKVELFSVFNIAFVICTAAILLLKRGDTKPNVVTEILDYIQSTDFVIVYVILCIMSIVLASRYAKQLFKKSAMNAYKEEV